MFDELKLQIAKLKEKTARMKTKLAAEKQLEQPIIKQVQEKDL